MNQSSPYHCEQAQRDIQHYLDGDDLDLLPDLSQHLSGCAHCSEQFRAATRLRSGLTKIKRPVPPIDLNERILKAVLQERITPRSVQKKRTPSIYWIGIAASILAVVAVGYWMLPLTRNVPVYTVVKKAEPSESRVVELPKLKDRLSSAGNSILNRTQRVSESLPSLPLPQMFAARIEKPGTDRLSLDRLGTSATETLQPLTSTTRRAFDLFRRELPIPSTGMRPNS